MKKKNNRIQVKHMVILKVKFHSEVPLHASQDGCYLKVYKQ